MSSQRDNIVASLSKDKSLWYLDGVIAGVHDFALHTGIPGGIATREELENMRHSLKFLTKLPIEMTDTEREDWADGYISGYNVRRNR